MKLGILVLAGLAVLTATPALASQGCLRGIDIKTFDAHGDRTLIVENFRHEKFQLSLFGTCSDLDFKQRLAFKTVGGGDLSCIGRGDEIRSRQFGSGIREVCVINKIEAYTPEMDAAYKAAKAAKEQEHN